MDSTALSRRSLIRMRSRVGRPKPHEVGFFVTPPKFLAGLGAPLDAAINLEVAEEELLHRLAGRGRADDNAQTIRNRLQVFVSSTRPLLDYYDGQGLLFSVAAAGTIDEVSERILHAPRDVTRRAPDARSQPATSGSDGVDVS